MSLRKWQGLYKSRTFEKLNENSIDESVLRKSLHHHHSLLPQHVQYSWDVQHLEEENKPLQVTGEQEDWLALSEQEVQSSTSNLRAESAALISALTIHCPSLQYALHYTTDHAYLLICEIRIMLNLPISWGMGLHKSNGCKVCHSVRTGMHKETISSLRLSWHTMLLINTLQLFTSG